MTNSEEIVHKVLVFIINNVGDIITFLSVLLYQVDHSDHLVQSDHPFRTDQTISNCFFDRLNDVER